MRDWEKVGDPALNPFIRCAMFPINWKSNFAAADEGVNFRTDFLHRVRKGDMVIREDGEVYLLTWAVHNQLNNQPSQAKRCNHYLTIKREVPEVIDDQGYLVEPAKEKTFIGEMPVCVYQYDGRPDYQASYNTPGISPDALIIVDLQFNAETEKIKINDEFYWGDSKCRVININLSGVNIARDAGMLQIHARYVSGGE